MAMKAGRPHTPGPAGRHRPREARADRTTPLERDHELRVVERALRSAEARRGGLALVTGPPGCGRSALLNALCEGPAAGYTVLRSVGSAAERRFAFGVVQQLFQPLLGARPAARTDAWFTGAAAAARAVLVDDPWSDEHNSDEAVLHALHALLLNVSSDRTVLLIVDDAQWADTASLTWLVYLAKRLGRARVLVVCAVTPEPSYQDAAADAADDLTGRRALLRELRDSAAFLLEPAPLSAAAVRQLLGPSVADELVEVCHEVTGGRAAAVTAAVSALHALGLVTADPDTAREQCQRALLTWRLAGLAAAPAGVRQLAGALAVLGEHADPHTLRELAELDDIGYAAAVRALDVLGVLDATAPPRFAHPSLPSTLSAAMGRETRERLHRAAARTLHAAGQPADPVAEHLLLGGGALDHWGVDVLRSAAAGAAERGAAGQAARLLRTAMLAGPADTRLHAQLTTDLAAVERDTDPLSCVQRVRSALPYLEPGAERAGAVLLVPPVFAASTHPIGDLIRRAGAELAASDQAGLHRGLALRLEARTRLLDLLGTARPGPARPSAPASAGSVPEPGAARLGARVRELLRSGAADTGAGRELLAVLAWEAVLTGGLPAAEVADLCGQVVHGEPADPAHVHTALSSLIGAAVAADATDVIGPWIDRAAAAARERGSAEVRACLAAEQAVLLAATGRLERARKLGIGLFRDADPAWPATRMFAASALGTVALQSQDVGLAELLLDTPWPLADRRMRITHRMLRGMVAAASRDLTGALAEFLDAGGELAQAGWTDAGCLPWRIWAAMTYARLGERDQAVELAEAALATARAWGAPTVLGRALRLLGMLTPGEPGVRLLREAVGVHRRSANQLELARSAIVLGRALRTGRLPGAAQLLADGERIARHCDASWPEGGPEGALVEPVPRLLRSGRDRLSPAESVVVELVQRGLSNAQIAEELSVTRRAVEKHLTSVYRKLGATGRASLLAELAPAAPNPEPRTRPHPPNRFP